MLMVVLSISTLSATLYDSPMNLLTGEVRKLDTPADPSIKLRSKRNQVRRTKLPGEITPVTVVNSGGKDTDKDVGQTYVSDKAPTLGILLYNNKVPLSAPMDSDHRMIKTNGTEELNVTSSRIKLGFDKVYCIDFVIRYKENGNVGLIWKCTKSSCTCGGENCSALVLDVSVEATTEGEISEPPLATSNCKFANLVTVQSNGGQLHEDEIAIHETKVDCPVGTSSTLVLSCLFGISLSVSIILTIILTRKWLKKCCVKSCRTSEVESDHEYVNNNFPLPTLPMSPAPPPPIRISSPSSALSLTSEQSQEGTSVAEDETADYVNSVEMSDVHKSIAINE